MIEKKKKPVSVTDILAPTTVIVFLTVSTVVYIGSMHSCVLLLLSAAFLDLPPATPLCGVHAQGH